MNCVSPVGITVGTVVPIMNALRPGEGSVCSAAVSRTVPCDAFEVSIIGDWPVTVMFSSSAPTSIVRSSGMNCCVPIGISFRSMVL